MLKNTGESRQKELGRVLEERCHKCGMGLSEVGEFG